MNNLNAWLMTPITTTRLVFGFSVFVAFIMGALLGGSCS